MKKYMQYPLGEKPETDVIEVNYDFVFEKGHLPGIVWPEDSVRWTVKTMSRSLMVGQWMIGRWNKAFGIKRCERSGGLNYFSDKSMRKLKRISKLRDEGYSLAQIKEIIK